VFIGIAYATFCQQTARLNRGCAAMTSARLLRLLDRDYPGGRGNLRDILRNIRFFNRFAAFAYVAQAHGGGLLFVGWRVDFRALCSHIRRLTFA
jgi:hypothetical protein